MNTPFTGQVALITGGADGLGFALAQRLTKSGAKVCLADISQDKLEAARKVLGESCTTFVVDVAQESAVAETLAAIKAAHGRLDILVNSAGITGKTNQKSHQVEPSDFDRVFAINVRGSFLFCHAALPLMLERDYGRILNIASIAGKEGNAGMVAYSASKAAVIGMTKSMGKEYAETGITINALAPAVIRTEMVEKLPPEQIKYMTDKIPMKRCGSLEEFAVTAEFIVSPANSFTTGFTFDLSGGRAVF